MSAHPRRAQRKRRDDYHPGGRSERAERRARARQAGYASGVKRRQLAAAKPKAPPRRRSRQEALALAYRHRQLTRAEFEARYRTARPRGNAAGLETAWRHYVGLFTRYRHEGQHYFTTNGQRAQALSHAGRERCTRTVRRLNRLMEELGLARVRVRQDRRRDAAGQWTRKDLLVIEISTQECPPPYGSRNEARSASVRSCSNGLNDPATAFDSAAYGGRDHARARAAPGAERRPNPGGDGESNDSQEGGSDAQQVDSGRVGGLSRALRPVRDGGDRRPRTMGVRDAEGEASRGGVPARGAVPEAAGGGPDADRARTEAQAAIRARLMELAPELAAKYDSAARATEPPASPREPPPAPDGRGSAP